TEEALPAHLSRAIAERLDTLAPCTLITVPAAKTRAALQPVEALGQAARAAGVTHASVIVALGGEGVHGVAALLAGRYCEGLRLVSLPTTLHAQITACLPLNHERPNGEGDHRSQFTAPQFIWAHLTFLDLLPAREIRVGLCELIKQTLTIKPALLGEVSALLRPDAHYTQAQLARVIECSIEVRTDLLAAGEREPYELLTLTYGQPIGCALERLARGQLLPGEAEGLGLLVSADIAQRRGLLAIPNVRTHYQLLRACGLPTAIPAIINPEQVLQIMRQDCQLTPYSPQPGTIDLVLLEGLGRPYRTAGSPLTSVTEQEVRDALQRCRAV
ncbi:MAG TPA: hypothetical protein VFV38_07830, partial [Ktedonobacteraceae bacterium]|nr:hypothetical protein [Ktedonobacteraceae bacterium]